MKEENKLFHVECSTIALIAMVWVSGEAVHAEDGPIYVESGPMASSLARPQAAISSVIGIFDAALNNTAGGIDDAFNQPGSSLVASPKSDKPCYLSDLLAKADKSSCQVVGGPWVRVLGGQTTTSMVGVTNRWGQVIGGTDLWHQSWENTIRQRTNYSGVQAGMDSGILNLEGIGVNVHFGLMGGKISARADSIDAPYPNSVNFEVPFLGAYYVLTKGNFMADFTYRHSWYDSKMTNVDLYLNDAPLNGRSDNVNASVSYRIALPSRFFVEPTANISYSRSTFDSPISGGMPVMDFDPVKSLLARGGARFGTSFSYGGYSWSPYAVALVANEFEKPTGAIFEKGLYSNTDMTTDRVGTYYQTSLGISFQSQTSGLVGFTRADYQTGSKIHGGGVVGGVRYSFGP